MKYRIYEAFPFNGYAYDKRFDNGIFDEKGVIDYLTSFNFDPNEVEKWRKNKDKKTIVTGKSLIVHYQLAIEPVI